MTFLENICVPRNAPMLNGLSIGENEVDFCGLFW